MFSESINKLSLQTPIICTFLIRKFSFSCMECNLDVVHVRTCVHAFYSTYIYISALTSDHGVSCNLPKKGHL